ncbi:MAG: zf-HC2 domain-containing protein [Candidatus Eremiobacteraeota bacterium]|nr:zf-HC2 domain-containing protein [Candidatus Eremiobacteraeota bacterium]
MRCSWCEPSLGAYVDGELSAPRKRAVAHHLRECPACSALYERLRNVDGLLLGASGTPLAEEFVSDVMTRVKAMPAHERTRMPALLQAVVYFALAWIGGFIVLVLFWRESAGAGANALRVAVSSGQAVSKAAHAIWPIAPLATSAGIALLSIDVLLVVATIFFYRSLRPRLAMHLSSRKEP